MQKQSGYLKNDSIEEFFTNINNIIQIAIKVPFIKYRSSSPEVFLGKSVLKIAANLQENTHAKV